jgi:hypothetical protein
MNLTQSDIACRFPLEDLDETFPSAASQQRTLH